MEMLLPPYNTRSLALGAVALLLELLLIEGCSGPYLYPRPIHEDTHKYVRLEARYGYGQDGPSLRFSHPLNLSETDWDLILKETYVKPTRRFPSIGTKEVAPRPAFTESDLQYLARNLVEAFNKAHPDEWVVFYLTHPRESQVTEITSGGLFVENRKIHLVLANYRQPVSMAFIQNEIWNNPLRPAGDMFYDIVQRRNQTLREERRWDLTQSLLATIPELEIDYTALLISTSDGQEKLGPLRSRGKKASTQELELKERLRTLGQLRGEGLITEKEYHEKRQKLLEEL